MIKEKKMFTLSPLPEKMLSYQRKSVTPVEVIYSENKLRVLKANNLPETGKAPILMIPAMINRHYILDLNQENSLFKELSEQGFPIYLLDWGEATPEDRWQTFTDIFLRVLKRVVAKVTRDAGQKPVLFGYCMGGTMASIYLSCFPDEASGLITLTAPFDFSRAGVMALWTDKKHLKPENLVDALGNVPPEMVQNGFVSLKPAKWLRKWETAWKKQDNEKFLSAFMDLENWVNDNVPFPGGVWQEYIKWLYQDNLFFKDELMIGNHHASLKRLKCPLLVLIANEDHIVPKECAEPLYEMAGSTDKTVKYFAGGHVGIISSPKLFPELRDTISVWLTDKANVSL